MKPFRLVESVVGVRVLVGPDALPIDNRTGDVVGADHIIGAVAQCAVADDQIAVERGIGLDEQAIVIADQMIGFDAITVREHPNSGPFSGSTVFFAMVATDASAAIHANAIGPIVEDGAIADDSAEPGGDAVRPVAAHVTVPDFTVGAGED